MRACRRGVKAGHRARRGNAGGLRWTQAARNTVTAVAAGTPREEEDGANASQPASHDRHRRGAGVRPARAQSADGQAGRAIRLQGAVPGRRFDGLPEDRHRGQPVADRDGAGRRRDPRHLGAAADPGRRLRLGRPDAHAPHDPHGRGRRLRGDRDRGPVAAEARASPYRHRTYHSARADARQGDGMPGRAALARVPDHCPHQCRARRGAGRGATARRGDAQGGCRHLAGAARQARPYPRHRRAAAGAADVHDERGAADLRAG